MLIDPLGTPVFVHATRHKRALFIFVHRNNHASAKASSKTLSAVGVESCRSAISPLAASSYTSDLCRTFSSFKPRRVKRARKTKNRVNGSDWLKRTDRTVFYCPFLTPESLL